MREISNGRCWRIAGRHDDCCVGMAKTEDQEGRWGRWQRLHLRGEGDELAVASAGNSTNVYLLGGVRLATSAARCGSIGGAVRVVSVLVASVARCGSIGGAVRASGESVGGIGCAARVAKCWGHRRRGAGGIGGAVRVASAAR